MSRYWLRLLASLLLLGLLLAACRRPPAGLEAPPVPQPVRRFQGVALTAYGTAERPELDRALIDRFSADTGIRVTVIPRPINTTETYATYDRLFRVRRSDVDVLLLDVIWSGAFAPYLIDLRPTLGQAARAHFPKSIRNNTVAGRLVAMPFYLDLGLLYYRSDLLEKYGYSSPPATWEGLERMAKVMQAGERGGDPDFWGFAWQGSAQEVLTCNALEWQVSHGGGRMVDPQTGRVEVDTSGAIAAFRRAAGWVGTISPLGVTSHASSDSAALFRAGHAAFMRNWAFVYADCNAPGSPVQGRFRVAALPHAEGPYRSASVLGGWQLGVSVYSKHPAAAVELVRYLTSPEVQAWRAAKGSFVPTIPEVLERPEGHVAQPLLASVEALLKDTVMRPSTRLAGRYNQVSTIYFEGVSAILEGEEAAPTAAWMQQDILQVLSWPESSVRTQP